MNRKLLVLSIVTLVGVVLDQATKWWVRVDPAVNAPGGLKIVPGFFSIVHAENPGAAFGMLGNLSQEWRIGIFVIFTLIALGIVWDMYRKLPATDWFLPGTLGLILSGALGNMIDRVYKPFLGVPNHRGELEYDATVTDFLRIYTEHPEWAEWLRSMFGTAEYPSFNVADINLVVGVGFFLIHYLFFEGREVDEEDAEAAPPGLPDTPSAPASSEAEEGEPGSGAEGREPSPEQAASEAEGREPSPEPSPDPPSPDQEDLASTAPAAPERRLAPKPAPPASPSAEDLPSD